MIQRFPEHSINTLHLFKVLMKHFLPQPTLPGFQFTRLIQGKFRNVAIGFKEHVLNRKFFILSPSLQPVSWTAAHIGRAIFLAMAAIFHVMAKQA
ncbi:hypothetical protein SDC9_155509 [bioreactor metagenome]|uniref:Uncharacterized protein n=1 Tax=bioreactor metagenome TaxID=1076179 RepID=A0A645F1Z3_9ZZZZ